jgi:ribosomal protein L11 methylase PrmA
MLLEQSKGGSYCLYTSTSILANVHYLIAKEFNQHIAKEQLKILSGIIQMLPFEPNDVQMALNSNHVDFEDTAQFLSLKSTNALL